MYCFFLSVVIPVLGYRDLSSSACQSRRRKCAREVHYAFVLVGEGMAEEVGFEGLFK